MNEPCPETWMLEMPDEDADICTVLRSIYHITGDPEIKLRARIATMMAKKMDARLRSYKKLLGG